jgi:hypothetical protein
MSLRPVGSADKENYQTVEIKQKFGMSVFRLSSPRRRREGVYCLINCHHVSSFYSDEF